jgi:assimilatory nitrate reductase catalytic subunit
MVQMHPQDMARRQIGEGDLVHLTSKRGSILLPARASAEIGLSQAFVAMHWGEEYLSGCSSTGTRLAGINALTTPAYCPTSKQPELKHTAVKILKAELPWSLLTMAWLPTDAVLAAHRALQPLMAMFPFATCVPFSGSTARTRRVPNAAASCSAPPRTMRRPMRCSSRSKPCSACKAPTPCATPTAAAASAVRCGWCAAPTRARASRPSCWAGDTSAEAWIATLLREELPAQSYGRLLLSPGARAPLAVQSRGKPVCTCFNVTDLAIQANWGAAAARPTSGWPRCRAR